VILLAIAMPVFRYVFYISNHSKRYMVTKTQVWIW